jgi:hypothetical protein
MQAVMAADFAVAQFRFLANLLLIHGRWNYKRIARIVGWVWALNPVGYEAADESIQAVCCVPARISSRNLLPSSLWSEPVPNPKTLSMAPLRMSRQVLFLQEHDIHPDPVLVQPVRAQQRAAAVR